jgi:PadR family transcriptional regulator PadR
VKKPGERLSLLKGTLDLLIMKALSQGPTHGYGITTWLHENSDGRIVAEDSAVYQALHRMEERRLIEAEWGVTENKRKARYYKLTKEGRAALKADAHTWRQYAESVAGLLALEGNGKS